MDIVRRSRYLDRLIAFQDTDLIKIVTGHTPLWQINVIGHDEGLSGATGGASRAFADL